MITRQSTKTPAKVRTFDLQGICDGLVSLASPNQCIAVWVKNACDGIQSQTKHRTGYFTDPTALVRAVAKYSGRADGVYIAINPICHEDLDDRTKRVAWNQFSPFAKPPENNLISERRQLLVDIDPVRSKDSSSTESEKQLAIRKAHKVQKYLRKLGWPKPLVIDSGNGVQMVWRVNLAVDDKGLVKSVLKALAGRFDDETVKIDTAVSAAKQLMRFPGTMNCKGESTSTRPHRLARVLQVPTKLKLVSKELLVQLAGVEVQATSEFPSVQPSSLDPKIFENATKYIDKIEPADRTHSDGSSKALLAAQKIVVGFNIPHDSEDAWTLLQRYNARCTPPWNLDDPGERHDLRRKLAETDRWATENHVDRGRLLGGEARHYEPLLGPQFPIAIPDYDWMTADTPKLVLNAAPFPFAYALRLLFVWKTAQTSAQIPDVLVRATHWGAKPAKNWRPAYLRALRAGHLKHRIVCTRRCDDTCPLGEGHRRHRHYSLPYEPCGDLDEFKVDNNRLLFSGEAREKWQAWIRQGRIYHGYWLPLIFGTSPRVGLSPDQVRLLMAITRELTRVPKHTGKPNEKGWIYNPKSPSDRPDRAQIFKGSLVHNSAYTADKIVCAQLDKKKNYVGFCGNFREHHGRGYRPGTWLKRAGYEGLKNPKSNFVRLLSDIDVLSQKFDLIVVGRHHGRGRWYDLAQIREMCQPHVFWQQVDKLMLRIYAPEDFLTLWRYRFAEWLGFSWIPGAECPYLEEQIPGQISSGDELMAWMKRHRVTQDRLAEAAGLSRRTISRGLKREKNSTNFWNKINTAIPKLSL